MTDNRALWEPVEKWRKYADETMSVQNEIMLSECADELVAILERPVVVGDEDVERAIAAYDEVVEDEHWSNEKPYSVNMPDAMRAALESMVRGKS